MYNFKFMFPEGRNKPTETEICLLIMTLALGVMLWQMCKIQTEMYDRTGKLVSAVIELNARQQVRPAKVPRGIWL